VAVITGGSRGIGAATARLLAEHHFDVCIGYRRDRESAETVAASCRTAGARAVTAAVDVAREDAVVDLFTTVDAELGSVAVLVNNAGIVAPKQRVDEMDGRRVEQMMAVNVVGTILCAREAVRRMSTRHGGAGGCIVNVSSAASRLGSPDEYVDYAASKGAVDTFTLGLAREVATEGIRVNAVRPGLIDTEIHARGGQPDRIERLRPLIPMLRPGSAPEVAESIVWLCSDAASYITGALLDVSGGR
jgi:NAD(P)-dependent dehydrogenase (short-subunit alcohol dehydrogenase family)